MQEFDASLDCELRIPKKEDGTAYDVESLYPGQRDIVSVVLGTIFDWLHCDDLAAFKPLRMTVNGSGGAGKSIVIDTIVALMRTMFKCNEVVKVVAPSGTAAFNVSGETIHHLLGMCVSKTEYKAHSMTKDKRSKLIAKFKSLLAVIVDERSLVKSSDLGTLERQVAETIFDGGPLSQYSWGGLPIVIVVGDDFQLPAPQGEG